MTRICLIPKVHGVGGMVSFQAKLADGLTARNIQVGNDLADTPYDAVLVTGGTRDLPALWKARRRGVRIIQRLDGINWLHRRVRTGWKHSLRAEYGNRVLALIRSRLVTGIVYQSNFVQAWWQDWFGPAQVPSAVIYNGVDLSVYTPDGTHQRPVERIRLLVVEGSIGGGYEMGLETAIHLAEAMSQETPLELMVLGRISVELQAYWQAKSRVPILWGGVVERGRIPELDRSAHLLYSADLNAACPNSVIEALACGLPVVAFATGALPELVSGDAGRVVPYGGDAWKLEPPDIPALASACGEVFHDPVRYRQGARQRAVDAFGLDKMVEKYLEILLG